MPEKHSHAVPGGRAYWWTERLWAEAQDLPVAFVSIDSIAELDADCWFGERHIPTIRAVAEHAARIEDADLSHPVLLSATGALMDGGHRIAKAFLLGYDSVAVRRFLRDPEPDWIEPDSP